MAAASRTGPGGIALAEESFATLLRTPGEALAYYYLGSVPFAAGMVVFWSTMSQYAYAPAVLPLHALLLALAFVWMKAWQARFARAQLAWLHGGAPPAFGGRAMLRLAARQGLLHAAGLFALPAALLMALPFPWVYAFFQHATAIDDGTRPGARAVAAAAARQAQAQPRQNALAVWLLCPLTPLYIAGFLFTATPAMLSIDSEFLGIFVFLYTALLGLVLLPAAPVATLLAFNVFSAIAAVLYLIGSLFGVDWVFASVAGASLNSTMFTMAAALAYLALDPLAKTAYVLRTFYAESRASGADLHAALRRLRAAAAPCALIALAAAAAPAARAETPAAPDPAALSQALDEVLAGEAFVWRMPRVEPEDDSPLRALLRSIDEQLRAVYELLAGAIEAMMDWIFGRDPSGGGGGVDLDAVGAVVETVLVALAALLALAVLVLAWRAWRGAARMPHAAVLPAAPAAPDLASDDTRADALPEEAWLQLADEMAARGDLRLAARALFLALLATLARRGLVRIARAKSNCDYAGELARRAHVHAPLLHGFRRAARLYEDVWYGDRAATPEGIAALRAHQAEAAAHA